MRDSIPPASSPTTPLVAARDLRSPTSSSFSAALRRAAESIGESEAAIARGLNAARRGQTLSPERLLMLQAGVYRYSQQLELASKLVDKATGAIRQVLTSQQ